jgi:hypothetical protein
MRPTRMTTQRQVLCHPYLVLLPVGFTLPPLLPKARCALTAPFHPYLLLGGLLSVALSLRSPSPDVIRHRVFGEPGLSSAHAQYPSNHLPLLYKTFLNAKQARDFETQTDFSNFIPACIRDRLILIKSSQTSFFWPGERRRYAG